MHLPTSLSCALKCIKKPLPLTPALSSQLQATQAEFQREVQVLRDHPHENICGFLDAFETRGKFVVAMELCRGGTVLERVEQMGHYPEGEAAYCMATVLNAVKFLHSLGIGGCSGHVSISATIAHPPFPTQNLTETAAHRDLKPQNLLYVLPIGNPLPQDSWAAAASLLKLCDFGVAGITARGMSTLIGKKAFGTRSLAFLNTFDPRNAVLPRARNPRGHWVKDPGSAGSRTRGIWRFRRHVELGLYHVLHARWKQSVPGLQRFRCFM